MLKGIPQEKRDGKWHLRHIEALNKQKARRKRRIALYHINKRGHFDKSKKIMTLDKAKRVADEAQLHKKSLWERIKDFISRLISRIEDFNKRKSAIQTK